jgi:isoquinoline 1-oxidoreductase beta subunit
MTMSINRRTFIKTTLLGFAGLTFGVNLAPSCQPNPDPVPTGDLTLWINIAEDNLVNFVVIKTEMGQGTSTALAMILAEELDADWSKVRVHLQCRVADPAFTGSSMTGGSTSIMSMYDPLRQAGAAAKDMLLTACAERWGVPKESLTAAKSIISHPSAGSITYGELALDASILPIPSNPPLKDPQNFRIIGQPLQRLETPKHVEGAPIFGMDVHMPGLLYAAVKQSPVFGGDVLNLKSLSVAGTKAQYIVGVPNGVAVVAESWWEAQRVLNDLPIQWYSPRKMVELDSAAIDAQLEADIAQEGKQSQLVGDPVGALQNAAQTVEATYQLPYLAHAPLGPINCTAYVRQDQCEVWVPTQAAEEILAIAIEVTKMRPENIRIYPTYVGGAFGRRLYAPEARQAIIISREIQKPIKLIWSRAEDMAQDRYRPISRAGLQGGLSAEKTITSWLGKLAGPSAMSELSGFSDIPYDLPNRGIYAVNSAIDIPTGAWRSIAYSHNVFCVESFIDELAQAAGIDPLTFRLNHVSNPRMRAVIERVAELANWGSPSIVGAGQGLAIINTSGTFVASVVEASLDSRKEVILHQAYVVADCGLVINPDIVRAQMEGGTIFGLTAAMFGEVTFSAGQAMLSNFHNYPLLTLARAPHVATAIIANREAPSGIGEWAVPPSMPALTNALFAATGQRIRRLPVKNYTFA